MNSTPKIKQAKIPELHPIGIFRAELVDMGPPRMMRTHDGFTASLTFKTVHGNVFVQLAGWPATFEAFAAALGFYKRHAWLLKVEHKAFHDATYYVAHVLWNRGPQDV